MTAARSATVRADRPDSRFAVRTPLLPFEVVEGWASGLDLPSRIGTAGFEESYRHWTTKLRERLRELVTDPVVADALLIASPSLAERLPEWERAPTSARGRKIELALVRYVMRMSARPTPFGLFSGCSIGDLGDATHFEIAPRARYQRHTRLDMDYLFSLCSALSRDPEVRDSLRYRTTTSLYRVAEAFRYFESRLERRSG